VSGPNKDFVVQQIQLAPSCQIGFLSWIFIVSANFQSGMVGYNYCIDKQVLSSINGILSKKYLVGSDKHL
jgi:hypothetical protein